MNFAQPSGRRNIDLTQRGMWLQPFGVGEVKVSTIIPLCEIHPPRSTSC